MSIDALELACRVADYVNDPAPSPAGKRIVKLASQIIHRFIDNDPPFNCDCHPIRCTDDQPCCGRRLQYNPDSENGPAFECERDCVCHD